MSEQQVDIQRHILPAADGVELGAVLYRPPLPQTSEQVVLVAGEAGLTQRAYAAYATYLAQQGLTALTFDYRGIGASRPVNRRLRAGLLDWGARDLQAALAWLLMEYAGYPLRVVGHGLGAELLGMAEACEQVTGLVAVAMRNHFWRLWPGLDRVGRLLSAYLLVPVGARLLLRYGTLPRQVALDLARASRQPGYLLDVFGGTDYNYYADFTAPLLALSFAGDTHAPPTTVDEMLLHYPNAAVTRRHITPAESGGLPVGHDGFFAGAPPESLWAGTTAWLRDPRPPEPTAPPAEE